jgi:hypothetical protein
MDYQNTYQNHLYPFMLHSKYELTSVDFSKDPSSLIFGNESSGLDENIDAMRLPDDERVIVSVHYYFATAHQSEFYDAEKKWNFLQKWSLYKTFRRMAETYLKEGYGVCKSEFGWTDRENIDNLVANTKYYVTLAEKFGFSMAVWDNGITDGDDICSFGIIDRNELKVVYPEYLEAIVE